MTTDWKGLCVELTDCLEKADWPHRYKVVFQQWTDIARAALADAALAQPEPEGPAPAGPSDEELLAMKSWSGHAFDSDLVDFARAVLARWGNHPASPDSSGNLKAGLTGSLADGEVAELVAWLRSTRAARLTRAADLLERLAAPPM